MWKKFNKNKHTISKWLLLRLSIKNCIKEIQENYEIDSSLRDIYIGSFEKVLEIMKQIENEKLDKKQELHIVASYDKSFSSLQSICWNREIVRNCDIDNYIRYIKDKYPRRIIYIDSERVYNGGYIDKYILDSVDTLAKEYFDDFMIDGGTVPTYHR